MSNDSNINTKDFMIGALIGGVVGAFTALMVAPKSGREIREDINDRSQTLKQKGATIALYAKDKSSDLAKTVSDQSNQVVSKVKDLQQHFKKHPDAEEEQQVSASMDERAANQDDTSYNGLDEEELD